MMLEMEGVLDKHPFHPPWSWHRSARDGPTLLWPPLGPLLSPPVCMLSRVPLFLSLPLPDVCVTSPFAGHINSAGQMRGLQYIRVCAHQTAPRVNAYLSITMISSYTQGGEFFKNPRLGDHHRT